MTSPTTSSTPRNVQTNLPADLTSFVGRRGELADVRRLLGAGRMLTLTGTGGVGKTRLALRVAADAARSGPYDAVWWVELADLRGPDAVAHALADVLGLRDGPELPLPDQLVRALGDRAVLLVVDNCEHLRASCGALLYELLRRCPRLRVLATSREPLGVAGEFVLPVPPLAFPGSDTAPTPDALAGFDSVSLFVERAAAGLPGFRLTEENAAAVARICAEIDGIPLAVELAAVRVRSLPLDSILRRLKDHSASAASPVGQPAHHRTLRASVQWSYELCGDRERTLWARLSAFPGGFDLDAACAVCGDPDATCPGAGPPLDPGTDAHAGGTIDAIAALVDKSILLREENDGRIRYRMLEILREFGHERLAEAGEREALRLRHRDWYLALAERSHGHWLGADQQRIVTQLREEYANLHAAFATSLELPDGADAALTLAAALEHYWLIRGWQTEGRQWLDAALAREGAPSAARARALRVNAYLTALQGDAEAAHTMVDRARALASDRGDRTELAWARMVAGMVELAAARRAQARESLDEALELFRAAGDRVGEAYTLVQLIALAAALGDLELAERCHARCTALTEPEHEVHLRSFALWGCGLAALRAGDTARALTLERTVLQLKHSLDDHLGTALAIEVLAWIEIAEGRDERAATLLGATGQLWSPMRMTMNAILDFGRFRAEYEGKLTGRMPGRELEAARRRGARMSVAQALPYALAQDGPAGDGEPNPLTARERQIAEQIAHGLTNRRIALDLTVSPRTVEGHINKIMTKLGFTNRAQIAAWASARRP